MFQNIEDFRIPLSQSKPKPVKKKLLNVSLVAADKFSYTQLTDIYNQTRVDYLVPMPMNEQKMREYVHNYDVDLTLSTVAMLGETPLGLAMLGVRGSDTWITRLGVIPNGRVRGVGQKLMDELLANARQIQANRVILEVIKNNTPAETLFKKCGFKVVRELLVTRRPPQSINVIRHGSHIEAVGYHEAVELLHRRTDVPSWVSATPSMINAGNLSGLVAGLPDGGRGYLVYQDTIFQLARLAINVEAGDPQAVTTALLENLHWRHNIQDTINENVPIDSPYWPAMARMGYLVSFERIEMILTL